MFRTTSLIALLSTIGCTPTQDTTPEASTAQSDRSNDTGVQPCIDDAFEPNDEIGQDLTIGHQDGLVVCPQSPDYWRVPVIDPHYAQAGVGGPTRVLIRGEPGASGTITAAAPFPSEPVEWDDQGAVIELSGEGNSTIEAGIVAVETDQPSARYSLWALPSDCAIDAFEPDTPSAFTPLGVPGEVHISEARSTDAFRFEVEPGEQLALDVRALFVDPAREWEVALLPDAGDPLSRQRSLPDGGQVSWLNENTWTQTYVLEVESALFLSAVSEHPNCPEYTVDVTRTFPACPEDALEPNDTVFQTTPVALNSTTSANIVGDNADLFQIPAPSAGNQTLIRGRTPPGSVPVQITPAEHVVHDYFGPVAITSTASDWQVVTSGRGGTCTDYTLEVTEVPCTVVGAEEPNDTRITATPQVTGLHWQSADPDWYALGTLRPGQAIVVEAGSVFTPGMQLHDDAGNTTSNGDPVWGQPTRSVALRNDTDEDRRVWAEVAPLPSGGSPAANGGCSVPYLLDVRVR